MNKTILKSSDSHFASKKIEKDITLDSTDLEEGQSLIQISNKNKQGVLEDEI